MKKLKKDLFIEAMMKEGSYITSDIHEFADEHLQNLNSLEVNIKDFKVWVKEYDCPGCGATKQSTIELCDSCKGIAQCKERNYHHWLIPGSNYVKVDSTQETAEEMTLTTECTDCKATWEATGDWEGKDDE